MSEEATDVDSSVHGSEPPQSSDKEEEDVTQPPRRKRFRVVASKIIQQVFILALISLTKKQYLKIFDMIVQDMQCYSNWTVTLKKYVVHSGKYT